MNTCVLDFNPTSAAVERLVMVYLGSLASRSRERFCAPALDSLARAGRTSPQGAGVVLDRLAARNRIIPAVRMVDGVRVEGWIVPRSRERVRIHRKAEAEPAPEMAAGGFTGRDKEFLTQCGIAAV